MNPSELKQHFEKVIAQIRANPELLKDKMWRLENLYVISTRRGKKSIFKMNRAQRHFIANKRPRNIILKSRQLGFSTLITLWILDYILFSPNKDGLAIAHTREEMSNIFDKKAKFAILNLPDDLRNLINFKQNSKSKLQIAFKDSSVSTFGVSTSGRSGCYQYVHISEFGKLAKAYPQRAEEVITGTFPAVPFDGEIFIESTAEGAVGRYYEMFMEAMENKARGVEGVFQVEFYPHFYNWTWDDDEMALRKDIISVADMQPNNDINWPEYQKLHSLTDKEMSFYYLTWISVGKDINRLNQEYPTTIDEAFISTGKPYFSARKVVECIAKSAEPETFDAIEGEIVDMYNGPLMVYEKPEPNKSYVIGGDVAEGLSTGDYSTLTCIEVATRKICAIYRGHVPPDEFYRVCSTLGKFYNNALLAIEVNKDGLWVNNELERSGYNNLYYRQKLDDVTKQMTKQFGWRTARDTRDSMLSEMLSVFSSMEFTCLPLLKEMMAFVRNSRGRPEAMAGNHDDLIISTAIAFQVRKLLFSEDFKINKGTAKPTSRLDIIFGML